MYSLEFAIKFLSNRIANFQKNVTSQMLYKVPEKSQNTIQIVEYIFLHKQQCETGKSGAIITLRLLIYKKGYQ